MCVFVKATAHIVYAIHRIQRVFVIIRAQKVIIHQRYIEKSENRLKFSDITVDEKARFARHLRGVHLPYPIIILTAYTQIQSCIVKLQQRRYLTKRAVVNPERSLRNGVDSQGGHVVEPYRGVQIDKKRNQSR
jgi:hypothetical protein